MYGVDQSGLPCRSLQGDPPFEEERHQLAIAKPSECVDQRPTAYRLQFGTHLLQIAGADAVFLDTLGRSNDYYRSCVERREHPGRGRNPKPPIEQDSRQGTAAMDLARRQQGIVCENGPGSNRDSVDLGAHRVGVPKRIVRADSACALPPSPPRDCRRSSRPS